MQRGRRRKRSWGVALIIVLLCCGVAFGIAKLRVGNSTSALGSFQGYDLGEVTQLEAVYNGYVFCNGYKIARTDSNGNQKWSYNVDSGTSFHASREGVAAWSGRNLTLLDEVTGYTGYSGAFDVDIISAKVSSSYCAVLLSPDHDSTIVLMEKAGRQVDSLTLENQLVVDYGFFYDGSLFWVMTLDSNGTTPNCTISVYRPGKRMVGNISDLEQVIYKPIFRMSDIICGGDEYLKSYSYTGEEQQSERKLIYGMVIADVYEGSGTPTIALVPNDQYGGNSDLRDVRVLKGNIDLRLHMPFDCVDLIAQDRAVYGFSADGYLMIGDIDKGTVSAYSVNIPCESVKGITEDGKAVILSGNTVYLVTVR